MTTFDAGVTEYRVAVLAAADRLSEASTTGVPCQPVRDLIGHSELRTSVDLAYAVQQELTARRVAGGAHVVGRKIGLTAPAVQRQLGVDQPDVGVLFDDMQVSPGEPIRPGHVLQPRIEAEVAFLLGADIDDSSATAATVAGAVLYAMAALEIVGSRIAGWDITIADTVADNASSGLFVLGAQRRTLKEVTPADVTMTMTIDGSPVSTGSGRDCLGDPLNALAWVARTAAQLGVPLRAGEVVLSGALGPMVSVTPGMHVHAIIEGLGEVTAIFAAEEEKP